MLRQTRVKSWSVIKIVIVSYYYIVVDNFMRMFLFAFSQFVTFFGKIVRVDAIDLIPKLSKSNLSSQIFGRLKNGCHMVLFEKCQGLI